MFDGQFVLDSEYTRVNGQEHDAELSVSGTYTLTEGFTSLAASLSLEAWEYPGPSYHYNGAEAEFSFHIDDHPDLNGDLELVLLYSFGANGSLNSWSVMGDVNFSLAGGDANASVSFTAGPNGVSATVGGAPVEGLNISVTGSKQSGGDYEVGLNISADLIEIFGN